MHKHRNWKRIAQALLVIFAAIVLTGLAKHYEFPDIQISHEEEIVIPGIEGEYEFLVLADLHLAIKTREDAGAYGASADERIAYFSNAKGTPSSKHLPQWVSYANQKEFDGVLMLGDMIDYYTDVIDEYLCEEVEKLEVPYVFTMGNHELFSPWNEPVSEKAGIYSLFEDGNTSFQVMDFDEFAVCAIDNNPYQVEPASLAGIREYFEANPAKPVILLAHVPFYTSNDPQLIDKSIAAWNQALVIGTGAKTRDTTQVSRDFLDLILGEDSPVVAIFTGDNHFYHKGNLSDSVTQWVLSPAFMGDGMIVRVKGN